MSSISHGSLLFHSPIDLADHAHLTLVTSFNFDIAVVVLASCSSLTLHLYVILSPPYRPASCGPDPGPGLCRSLFHDETSPGTCLVVLSCRPYHRGLYACHAYLCLSRALEIENDENEGKSDEFQELELW